MTTKKQEGCLSANKSASYSLLWNSLGAKPKNKSFPCKMEGRLMERTQHAVLL